MSGLVSVLLVVFLAGTIAWLFYYTIIRPFLLDSVQDELERMKVEVDWAIIDGMDGAQGPAAQKLRSRLENIHGIRWVTIGQGVCLYHLRKTQIKAETVMEQQMLERSPKWVRDLNSRHTRVVVKAALANSPTWWVPLAFIFLGSVFSRKLENVLANTETAVVELKPVCS